QCIGNYGAFTYYLFDQPQESLILTGISVGIYIVAALGLNIVVGFAGLLDLGYVAFFVFGAYTVAVFTFGFIQVPKGTTFENVPVPTFSFWYLLIAAAVVAGVFGALLGAPTLRLRGDYLAIVTLGFGEIVPIFFRNVPWFFQQNGISASGPDDFCPSVFSNRGDTICYYYLTRAVGVVIIMAVTSLRGSSLGRAWVAIREDETAAATSGVNLVRTKLLAFGLGAVLGGIAGALYAGYLQTIQTTAFNFN